MCSSMFGVKSDYVGLQDCCLVSIRQRSGRTRFPHFHDRSVNLEDPHGTYLRHVATDLPDYTTEHSKCYGEVSNIIYLKTVNHKRL
jgi:hypothetical protein